MGIICDTCSNKEKDEDSDFMNKESFSPKNSIILDDIKIKKEEKNKYVPRSFSITPASRTVKKYGIQTETIAMNRNRNDSKINEYEITDISEIKREKQKQNYSMSKYIPKIKQPIDQASKTLNIKKEYTAFEKSLKNIKDNKFKNEPAKSIFGSNS